MYSANDLSSSSPDLTVSVSFTDERGRLKDELIHRFQYEVEHSLSSAVLDFQSQQIYGFCNQVSYICSYLLPEKVRQYLSVLLFSLETKIHTLC